MLVKRLPLEIDPEFQLVGAVEMRRGQKQVGDPLLPVRVAAQVGEKVSQVPEGRDFVQLDALRRVAQQRAVVGEAHIEQRPAPEVMLVANGAHEERLAMIGGGLEGV
jgi:hypothetical protein